jgi:hypothetical protein
VIVVLVVSVTVVTNFTKKQHQNRFEAILQPYLLKKSIILETQLTKHDAKESQVQQTEFIKKK